MYTVIKSNFKKEKGKTTWSAKLMFSGSHVADITGAGTDFKPEDIELNSFGIPQARIRQEKGYKWLQKNHPDKDLLEYISELMQAAYIRRTEVLNKSILDSKCRTCIVYGRELEIVGQTNLGTPIEELIQTPEGRKKISDRLEQISTLLILENAEVLNKNIPHELFPKQLLNV